MGVKSNAKKTGRPAKVEGEKGTKEKIFDAAIDLFSEKGYEAVSIRDIARAVGITEGAIYRHYASKDAILESIFTYVENNLYARPPGGSIEALVEALSFREFLESAPRYMLTDPIMIRITRIMLIEMYHNEKIRDYIQRELFIRPVDETEAIFRTFMEKGKIRRCDPRALSALYISYLVSWYLQTFILSYGVEQELDRTEKTTQAQISLLVDLLQPGGTDV